MKTGIQAKSWCIFWFLNFKFGPISSNCFWNLHWKSIIILSCLTRIVDFFKLFKTLQHVECFSCINNSVVLYYFLCGVFNFSCTIKVVVLKSCSELSLFHSMRNMHIWPAQSCTGTHLTHALLFMLFWLKSF